MKSSIKKGTFLLSIKERNLSNVICACDADFLSKGDLIRHIASVHEGKVQCDLCGGSIKKKSQFEKSHRSIS